MSLISPRHLSASCRIRVFSSDMHRHAKVRLVRRRSMTSMRSSRVRGRGGGPGGGLGDPPPATSPLTPPLPLPRPLPPIALLLLSSSLRRRRQLIAVVSIFQIWKERHRNIDIIAVQSTLVECFFSHDL